MNLRRPLVLAAVVLAAAVPSSRAAEVTPEVGWWTQSQLAGIPIGTAALVAPGGTQVAASAGGPISVAAVRFPADPSRVHELVLSVDLLSTPETANVVACPTTSDWEPTVAGELAEAPTWDCDLAQTGGAYDPQARLLRWSLEPTFVRDGSISVALLPTAGAAAFTMNLTTPAEGAVVSSPAAGAGSTTTTSAPAATAPTVSAPSGGGSVSLPRTPDVGEGFSVDSGPSGLSSPLPTVAPTPAADEIAAVPITSPGDDDSGVARVLALLVLAGAGVSALVLLRSGGDGGSERGVGRFRHTRTGAATPV